MSVYNDIMASLNELLDDAQGKETDVKKHKITVRELPDFSPQEIRQTRIKAA